MHTSIHKDRQTGMMNPTFPFRNFVKAFKNATTFFKKSTKIDEEL